MIEPKWKQYARVQHIAQETVKEAYGMARSRAVEVEELEELEDLEDLADEDVVDAEVEEEEDDEDEAPRRKKKTSVKVNAKAKTKKSSDGVGSAELAEALGTDGRNLRVMLRDKKVKKDENNRYHWDSVDDALEAMGFDDVEEAQDALKESRTKRLEALKNRDKKDEAPAKATKAKAKAPVVEDDEDEDEEEDEEPAPPKKVVKKKTRAA